MQDWGQPKHAVLVASSFASQKLAALQEFATDTTGGSMKQKIRENWVCFFAPYLVRPLLLVWQ